jgi:outer membrane protein assembly factor BamB
LNTLCRLSLTLVVILQLLILNQSAFSETAVGWPHLRGPHYDGVSTETGLAERWPAIGPPVLWVKELGQGYSSCVAQDDRVYTQYQTLAGQFVLCVNAETGKTLWEYRYDWPFEITGQYPGPFSTPTLAEEHVYFTTPAGSVGCLTLAGKLVWSRDLKQEFDGQGTDFGYACSPTVIDGKVILPIGGRGASLVALNARSGELVWKNGDEAASYVGVLPIQIGDQRQVVGYLQHCLVGCDLKTGERRWTETLSHGYDEHSCWPIYREPLLWTSAPFQSGSHLWSLSSPSSTRIEPDSAETLISERWYCEAMSNDVSSSVLVGDTIYGFDLAEAQSKAHRPSRGSFRAIDWETGNLRWSNGDAQTRRATDFASNAAEQIVGHASVLAADGKLYLLNDLGDLILIEANPDAYRELGRVRVLGGEIGWASLALDQSKLFVRNRSRMVCLDVGPAESAAVSAMNSSLRASDIPQGEVRDYASLIGIEPEYSMDPPTQRWLWNWYIYGFGILLVSQLFGWIVAEIGSRFGYSFRSEIAFYVIAFGLGVFLGPVLSLRWHDFIFTWPSCLFVTLMAAVEHSEVRRNSSATRSRREFFVSVFIATAFLLTCIAYFLLCRRLSLVTQWSFLFGFPAAIPCLLWERYLRTKRRATRIERWQSTIVRVLLWQLAYAAYYGFIVAILFTNYEIPIA